MKIKDRIREFIYARYNISFSKSGDDIQLRKFIGTKIPGTYVDIGCWHPRNASNTYYFYVRNWRGICIDPNPEMKPLFDEFRPRDLFLNHGVGHKGSLTYYMLEGGYSSMNTFDAEFLKRKDIENRVVRTLEVPLVPLAKILDDNLRPGERLDFFDIDVEGLDLEVLKTNDWNKYRPKIVLIETNLAINEDITSDTVSYLAGCDYDLVAKTVIKGNLGNLFLIDKHNAG
jgi:FkbM family methyltransferase